MKRKALLLTTRPSTAEMEELVYALGADLAGVERQKRAQPDPQLFLGRGRMEEARETARALGADIIVVDGALKPGQIFSLQRFFGEPTVDVYDRTRLILEIFKERAHSPEARLQVELAQLHYDMPLVREAISMQKRGERQAAMFGSGEYAADVEYDRMKGRMARIWRELDKMRAERGVRRKHRRRSGFHLVSLAGYTNAGKSSLLKALSQRHTLVENRYFSTLSTKTVRAQAGKREVLLTDTVGFIEDLPPWLVEAFHSTLEEIALSDVILLVVDASDSIPEMSRRLRSSLRVLWEFMGRGTEDDDRAPLLVVLNKVDRLAPGEVEERRRALEEEGLLVPGMSVALSAKTGEGLPELSQRLSSLLLDQDGLRAASSKGHVRDEPPRRSAATRKYDFPE